MQKKWATSPESDPCKRCCCCFAWKSKYCAQTLLHRDLEIEGRDGAAAGDRDRHGDGGDLEEDLRHQASRGICLVMRKKAEESLMK
jgi:hypothetical protein